MDEDLSTLADDTTEDRYQMIVGAGVVTIEDAVSGRVVATYRGRKRLLEATAFAERLNAAPPEPVTVTPAAFLATLPPYAARQRTDALLAEAREIEAEAARILREDRVILSRAQAARRTLEGRLDALRAAESAQNATGVRQGSNAAQSPSGGFDFGYAFSDEFKIGIARYAPGPY